MSSFYLLRLFHFNNYSETAIGGGVIGFAYAITWKQKRNFWPIFHPIFAFLTLGVSLKAIEFILGIFKYEVHIFFKDFFLCQGIASFLGLCVILFLRNIKTPLTTK
jgi:hypothetical protein